MLSVTFIGTGEALDPELANSCQLVRGDRTLLIDCGFSAVQAFRRIEQDPSALDAVYITHRHADHSFGLPALLLWMRAQGRRRPLEIVGGGGTGEWLRKLLELAYPGAFATTKCFPLEPRELTPESEYRLGAMRLRCARSRHGVQNLALRVDEGAQSVALSGDGAATRETAALYRGVSLLVHEAYRLSEPSRGHFSAHAAGQLARDSGVAELALTHIEASERVDVELWAEAWAAGPRVWVPRPGETWPSDG